MMDLCFWQLDFLNVIELVILVDVVHQWYSPKSAFVPPSSDDWLTPQQDVHVSQVVYFDPFVAWSKHCRVTIGG